jgi:hypothetical protein
MSVAERAFVKDAYTPSVCLETLASARFAILNELAKQVMNELKNL